MPIHNKSSPVLVELEKQKMNYYWYLNDWVLKYYN